MAYPSTIASYSSFGRPAWFPSPRGPFLSSAGNRYTVGVNRQTGSPVFLKVSKSTNTGLSWTVQDEAGSPAMSVTMLSRNFSAIQRGDVLYIAANAAADNTACIYAFDLATDEWSTIATGGPVVGGSEFIVSPNNDGGAMLNLERHADGSFILLYVTNGGTGRFFCAYVKCSAAGAWDAPVSLGGGSTGEPAYFANGIVLGDDGVRHFILNGIDTLGSINGIYHVSLDSSDVLSSIQTVALDAVPSQEPYVGYPASRVTGGQTEIIVPYVRGTSLVSNRAAVARAISAETPSWTIENIGSANHSPSTAISSFLNVAIAVIGEVLYAVWIGETATPFVQRIWYSINDGNGWRVERLLYTAPDAIFITVTNALALTDSVGIVTTDINNIETETDEGGATLYFEFTPTIGATNYCFGT